MNIKKITIGLIFGIAASLSSCQDVLDIEPIYVKDGSHIFTTLDDYEFALTGSYRLLRSIGYFGSGSQTTSTWANLPDMMSDNLVRTSEDLANWQNQVDFTYVSNDTNILVSWLAAYSVIAQTNLTLRNIDQFLKEEPQKVNRIKGQALALRAMVHFDLLRFWGESYERNSTGWGIPYKEVVDINDMPGRLSVKESYDKILRDMEEAEELLENVDKNINSATRPYLDQIGVRALLSRIYLYAQDYEKAEYYATLVINEIPLASRSNFPLIWTDASNAEVIWRVPFNAGEGSPSSGLHNAPSNRNRFRPSVTLESLYDQENDVRFSSYFGNRSLSGNIRRIVLKFHSRGGALDNLVDWKVIRVSELYLIRAEARALQGNKEDQALADLNALRFARITGYVDENLSGQDLLDAIAVERRKELVGEGHRWFDIKRTTRTLDRSDDCGAVARTCSLGSDAREWVWPIPQEEIDVNENIKNHQSPLY